MASDFLESSECLLALVVLLALVPFIVHMVLSDRQDARMGFLMDLMERFPKSDDP